MNRIFAAASALLLVPNVTFAGTFSGIDTGGLVKYYMMLTHGSDKAAWQAASEGDSAVKGEITTLQTLGRFSFDGKPIANPGTPQSWSGILAANPTTAASRLEHSARAGALERYPDSAAVNIDSLTSTVGFADFPTDTLAGLNTRNDISETYVINLATVTSSSKPLDVTTDAAGIFIVRWDIDTGPAGPPDRTNVQSGGKIAGPRAPGAANFISVAAIINAAGSGSVRSGLRMDADALDTAFSGHGAGAGGFFGGYWFALGAPADGVNGSLSTAIIVGSLYTNAPDTTGSGSARVAVAAPAVASSAVVPLPASLSFLLIGLGGLAARAWLKANRKSIA
ncbi:MAG: hypothetical protein ACI9IV_000555 [Paracoccaceae bacterium]|jgi:hypothetical protein